jgi:hypothetical protein
MKLKCHKVFPQIISTRFDSLNLPLTQTKLNLSTEYRNNILKNFIKNDSVYIYNGDIVSKIYTEYMIGINDPIPEITKIIFDMTYCLSCLKIQTPSNLIKTHNGQIIKTCHPIEQPYFCSDCFDFLRKIIPGNSDTINITGEIIDLCLLREKFSALIMGFKYDETCIIYQSNPDVIQYITYFYLASIKLLMFKIISA